MATIVTRAGKGSPLTNNEMDTNLTNLNTDKIEVDTTDTLTNKSIALGSNTVTGTIAQFNTAVTDADFATLAGTEVLTNKDITSTTNTVYANAGPSNSPFSFRNKIIGGDFTTNPWQRGTSFTAPASSSYTADRFRITNGTDGIYNVLKTADAPTVVEAGAFSQHCFHIDVTTADAAIGAAQAALIIQAVEGLNAATFGFGQSGTRYVTLSFWHKHTKTGTYCVAVQNSAVNRSYVAEYVQDVSDTWEKATITVPVDTAGTWLYDTGVGLYLIFSVAAGTAFHTTAGAWAAGNFVATANQVNALDSTSNNFKIALVQLESGQTATPFEARAYGTELSLCQRYYNKFINSLVAGNNTAAGVVYTDIGYPVTFRTAPSIVITNNVTNNASVATLTTSFIDHFRGQVTITATGYGYSTFDFTASADI